MIDIHAHILPGVDDGPKDMEAALALLRQAAQAGITQVVATPHYHLPSFDNINARDQFEALKLAAKEANLTIQLHLGNEVYADDEAPGHLVKGKAKTLAGTQYVLLELPQTQMYPVHQDLIYRLQRSGYQVILAHVDRYSYFRERPERLRDLIDKGCYGQLSADHVISRPREAKRWIEAGYAHFIASDMHCSRRRPNRMDQAHKQVQKTLGEPWAHQLFIENPTAMLHQRGVLRMPTRDLKRSWLQTFIG